jgi:hypothetical protein
MSTPMPLTLVTVVVSLVGGRAHNCRRPGKWNTKEATTNTYAESEDQSYD